MNFSLLILSLGLSLGSPSDSLICEFNNSELNQQVSQECLIKDLERKSLIDSLILENRNKNNKSFVLENIEIANSGDFNNELSLTFEDKNRNLIQNKVISTIGDLGELEVFELSGSSLSFSEAKLLLNQDRLPKVAFGVDMELKEVNQFGY